MFPYTKLDLCDLIVLSLSDFPQIITIWSYVQDDGFGNLISTFEMCIADLTYTNYIINFLGYNSIYGEFSPNQYGDH